MIFNDVDLTPYMDIKSIKGRGVVDRKINAITVPGMDGEHFNSVETPAREIEIEFDIRASDIAELRAKIDELNGILAVDEPVPFVFPDEPDKTYWGTPESSDEGNEYIFAAKHQAKIVIRRSDPYKYGPEKTIDFTSDVLQLNVDGTAPADPIFELQVIKPITFAMVQNQNDEYMMIGRPVDVSEEVVDERTPLITENGDTLDKWYLPPGTWLGNFASSGDAIVIKSFGTGNEWHGPALMQEITPTDDYEIELYCYTRTEQPYQTFRISTNYYDEQMNELGLLRLWDKTTNQIKKVVEARIGPYVDQYKNYLISDQNYNLQGQRVWGGVIRVRKEGNKFTFYAARITQSGRHESPLTKTFVDLGNQYAGRLKFIRFDAATYGSKGYPNEIRIEHIKVTKLNKAKVDQTPYIARVGDSITFDHKTKEILINGEDRKDLKDFGGSFFRLSKRFNQLILHPDNSLMGSVKYQNRYR